MVHSQGGFRVPQTILELDAHDAGSKAQYMLILNWLSFAHRESSYKDSFLSYNPNPRVRIGVPAHLARIHHPITYPRGNM